ncbi:helix-turn-helix domain-containing protein [Nocardia sp. NPDC051990]|uniref:AraC family transcriptional regulator n=1 Tax=Nocardia sp. NPDC051990 TaxID=3155285 RepID=UPI00341F88E9
MPVESVRVAASVVDIAVPSRAGGLPGVSMAGFRGYADGLVDFQMVPYPALTIFIDFGDALLIDGVSGDRKRGSIVVGLAPCSFRGCGRDVDLLQIRLSPVIAHAVFSVGSELGGAAVALADLWGPEARRIQQQLHAAGSWDDRFAIAQSAIARRRAAGRAVDPEVAFVWGQMMRSRGRVRVERLADEVGWSRKRLWFRFRDQIGLTPKHAARLVRFDHAAHRLAAGHSAALVAADCGFADQSHMHRDAMAFAGMTPTAVAEAPWLAVDDIAWPTTKQALPLEG